MSDLKKASEKLIRDAYSMIEILATDCKNAERIRELADDIMNLEHAVEQNESIIEAHKNFM
jgi:hypothetical protein